MTKYRTGDKGGRRGVSEDTAPFLEKVSRCFRLGDAEAGQMAKSKT